MFIATVLVLSMMPGLAFFESGLLRRRSALSVVTQVFVGISVLNLLWFLFGFSLVFGGSYGGVIGDFRYALFRNLRNRCIENAPTIPGLSEKKKYVLSVCVSLMLFLQTLRAFR